MNKFLYITYWRCYEARIYSFWCCFGIALLAVMLCMAVTNYTLFGWLPPFTWVAITFMFFALPTGLKVRFMQKGETLEQSIYLGSLKLFTRAKTIGKGYWEVIPVNQMYTLVYKQEGGRDIELPYRLKHIPLFLN